MPVLVLGDVLAGILLAVLILALFAATFVAAHAIPNVPLIGGAIRSMVVSAINAVASRLRAWAQDTMIPLAFAVQGAALTLWWGVWAIGSFLAATPTFVVHYYEAALAYAGAVYWDAVGWFGQAETFAADEARAALFDSLAATATLETKVISWVNTLDDQLAATYTDAITVAAYDTDVLESKVLGWVDVIDGQLVDLGSEIAGGVAHLAATITADIAAEASRAEAEIAAAVASAEAVAASLAAAASVGAVHSLDQAVADVINPGLRALESDLAQVAAALGADVLAIPGLQQLLANPAVTGTAAAIAALGTAVGAIARELTDCVTPYCSDISALSKLLRALEDVALWAALLALLIEAAHDPGAIVRDVEGPLADLARGAASSFRALIGI
jgi:hypothetical protein